MIIDSIIDFLNTQAEKVGLPSVMVDYLATKDCLSLQTISQPSIEREYIDGTTIRKVSFRLTRKGGEKATSSLPSLEIISSLEAFAMLFEGMDNFALDDTYTIVRATVTLPSILARDTEKEVVYGVTINVTYKE